ncbi:hypothetical protein Maq22A_2p42780 (plasmid) [Methylobacterium aquaticum]|uniref:Transposase and inactivated derivatives n=1 Tax=Methylobacterium aquaticum TaxID=270351 RepID=A0A1Y0ZH70_9HYPH|nr:hypothetical protein Maq22A_2p42780 [Methylobacterium aquaticum]
MNAVEGFFSALIRRRLKRGGFSGIVDLPAAINRYITDYNGRPMLFVWTKAAAAILNAVNGNATPSSWLSVLARQHVAQRLGRSARPGSASLPSEVSLGLIRRCRFMLLESIAPIGERSTLRPTHPARLIGPGYPITMADCLAPSRPCIRCDLRRMGS